MVRLIVLFDAPADPEAFERHYGEVHIPLAKKLSGLRSYKIGSNAVAIRGEPFYRIAELEWDDMAALQHAFATPEGRAAADDLANLAPTGAVRSMVIEPEEA